MLDSSRDHVRGIGRHSYGYQRRVIQVDPIHPQEYTDDVHADLELFRLVVDSVKTTG